MKTLGLSLVILFLAATAHAAYQNPTVESNSQQSDGSIKLVLLFKGNAGEPDVRLPYIVQSLLTPEQKKQARNWVDEKITRLDNATSSTQVAEIQIGTVIPRLARVGVAPSAKQVWRDKLFRYLQIKDAGITAAASGLAAIKADLEATYQAGFLDE